MTREEAIETLRANYPDACFEQLREAVDMAIEALSHEIRTETHGVCSEQATDLISRQDAIKEIDRYWKASRTDNRGIEHTATVGEHAAVDICKIAIQSMPSADRPKGECRTCARNADNGGYYEPEHRTRCPIQEHYMLLQDGYCHLYEQI